MLLGLHRYESTLHSSVATRSRRNNDVFIKKLIPRIQTAQFRLITGTRRSEPSSRSALMGEQTNPWDLLQPQDALSRHRGSDPRRRYGRSGATTLLSPG